MSVFSLTLSRQQAINALMRQGHIEVNEVVPIVGLSHPRASTRVPDPIHGVIELTVFDRDIVDSRAFQRLHFVLQQSVSYTSFPANKNTRFPHSLGTAHSVGRMFSAALSNAAPDTLRSFLQDSAEFIATLSEHVSSTQGGLGPGKKKTTTLDCIQSAHKFTISGASGFRHSPLSVVSGVKLQTGNEWRVDPSEQFFTSKGNVSAGFVVDTIWQSLRIYALTHDIGHLPMSHAFENAISNVPRTIREHFPGSDSEERFKKMRQQARKDFSGLDEEEDEGDFFNLLTELIDADREIVEAQVRNKPLHEVRSFSILNKILVDGAPLSDGFPKLKTKEDRDNLDLYGRLVHNLALCIVYSRSMLETGNKNKTDIHPAAFLYSIRQLVDGIIDGDRLDYTLRDCHSAGTRFGDFDLERIIRNCILLEKKSKRTLTTKEQTSYKKSKKKMPKDGLIDCKLYAVGFGPQALPGIEQFFEARYQSYKYLVHHRTASRSNIAMEVLIENLFAYCAEDPSSECAKILERFRYISLEGSALKSVLPVFSEAIEEIDDSSLRSLLHQVRNQLKSDLKASGFSETPLGEIGSKIVALSEVVLFRDFRHIVTLFRDETPESLIQKRLRLSAEDSLLLRQDIENNLTEFMSNVRKASRDGAALGLAAPVVIMHERAAPKVFRNDSDDMSAFEQGCWLWDPRGYELPIGDKRVSATLANMADNRLDDTKIRLYAVSNDIRANGDGITAVQDLVIQQLRDWHERKPKPKP